MPNFFFKRKDRPEELFVRPNLKEFARTDSIDSDATALNNPGPGRTIGLLIDAAGAKIERFLNQRAAQRGLGPRAIVEDIHQLRRVRFRREMSLWEAARERSEVPFTERPKTPFTDQECTILKRRCRKLLKYCRSHVLETQLEALEAITTVAIEDPHVRQVLASVLHHKYLIPKYKEPELCIQSFRALLSVKDNEVYDFFGYLEEHNFLLERESISPQECHLLNRLESYLRNSDVSFLLQRLIGDQGSSVQLTLISTYVHVASTNPDIVEWETLRGQISFIKYYIRRFSIDDIMRLARYFPILHLYQSDQDRFTDSDPDNDGLRNLEEFARGSLDVLRFLGCLCGSEDLATQLQFLRYLEEDTRRLFQGTVFNEIHIALAHACHHDDLSLTRATCLETAAVVLLRYYSCGNPDQQALAKQAITQSMKSSRYFKLALTATCQCNDACGADMSSFKLPEGIPFEWRSCRYYRKDVNRGLLERNIDIEPAGEDMGMHIDDVLYNETSWEDNFDKTCWLEVVGHENPFNVTGHFPVLAGFDTSGKQLYVARIELNFGYFYSYVSDGARSLPICDDRGEVGVFDRFYVLVLRHDPCDFGETNIPADAKLQTGPVFWGRDGNEKSDGGFPRVSLQHFPWKSAYWVDDLAAYAGERFGDSNLLEIGEERFKDVTESDSEEAEALGSKESFGEELEGVGSETDIDAVHERGVLKLQGKGTEEERDRPISIEDEERQLEEKKQAFMRGIEEIEERQRDLQALRLTTSQGSRVGQTTWGNATCSASENISVPRF